MIPINSKPALIDQVYEQIKQAIITGDLLPCAPLAQEALAAELGVSRQPVSHALILLEKDGLVVEKGRKGRMVAPLDNHQLLGLYQVRGVLDGLAASLCAAQSDIAQKIDFDRLLADGFAAIKNQNVQQLVAADIAFHTEIYHGSGNPQIFNAVQAGWPHMVRAMHNVLSGAISAADIWQDHQNIAKAICEGDRQGAGEIATSHAQTSGDLTFKTLLKEQQKSA
jgi:DNA-binding GntR family transcriptional regulator